MRAHFASPLLALLALSCASPAPTTEATAAPLSEEARAPRGRPGSPLVDPRTPALHPVPEVSLAEPPLDLEALQGRPCKAPADYATVDLEVLLGDPQPWDGAAVAAFGPVFPQIICTMAMCPAPATCCRRCIKGQSMNGPPGSGNGVDDHVSIHIAQPECVQTCDCQETSGPIGDALVWGTFRFHGDSVSIETDGFCQP